MELNGMNLPGLSTARGCYRLGLTLTVLTALFLVLAIGALGLIGAGGEADRPYLAVLAVGVVGAVLSRLRASGMALTVAAMALVQVGVPVVAYLVGDTDGLSRGQKLDVVALTAMYVVLFGAAAWLFRRAAELA
ncbi:hypothetical protein [Nocardioides houyundeii]|uniref:hypothetical protein n=1 Tax=Nocardioides houyundeii TaxID=2045452 RepID=UPI000C77D7F0|nr:hypothetical protein [Nocardioides houyundeii]